MLIASFYGCGLGLFVGDLAMAIFRSWKSSVFAGAVCLAGLSPGAHAAGVPAEYQWKIKSTSWSATDEQRYAEFISILGKAVKRRKCNNVHRCLKSKKANPFYAASDPKRMRFYADCADLPHMLRAYFAWKNGLPFSYATALSPRGGRSRDVRYSPRGNSVLKRVDVVQKARNKPIDVRKVFTHIKDSIHSGHFRILHKPKDPGLPDFYPSTIDPKSIRPGTAIYDPNGHVAVVYEVTKDGRVLFIDAHPDNSLTQGTYGKRFTQKSAPNIAPGFKNWREISLEGATADADGNLIGGKVTLAANEEIKDYSTEQYFGTEKLKKKKRWTRRRFKVRGSRVGWYDFVRTRLAGRELRYKPVEEFRYMIEGLCADLAYRVDSIDVAIARNLHKKAQPARFPRNIYGTTGEWEFFSTPSRDARLKTSFKELRDTAARFLKLHKQRSRTIDYKGNDLRGDLLAAYREVSAACNVRYENSAGTSVELPFQEVSDRLFKLSFDPYHCVERRWGASGEELASCRDGGVKTAWYEAEQRLRNQIERKYDARMDFTLAKLKKGGRGTGVDAPPDIDVLKLLGGR